MTRRRYAAVLGLATALSVAGCQGDTPGNTDAVARATPNLRATQKCSAGDVSLVVDSAGIGPVLLHTVRVAELRERCTVSDTSITLSEGMVERAHLIDVNGHAVTALSTGTPDTSFVRVIATDAAFKTAGGVGVGSSAQALRLAHGSLCAAQGEGNFIIMAANLPGVSFAIDWSPPPSRDPSVASPFPGGDPGTSLDATRITKVWVHGVTGGCRVGVG